MAQRAKLTKEKKAEVRRELILKSAAKVFAAKGYSGTTVEDIARDLELTKGSLYYYIKSKDDILFELHKMGLDLLLTQIRKIQQGHERPEVKLREVLRYHIYLLCAEKPLLTVLMQQSQHLLPEQRELIVGMRDEYERLFQSILKEGAHEGIFSFVDYKLVSYVMLGSVNSILDWYNPEGRLDRETVTEMIVEFLMSGLLPSRVAQQDQLKDHSKN